MSKEVVIKSNRYGINLVLDSHIPFQELLEHVADKFRETGDFFKDSQMAISFKNRELTAEEEQQMIEVIMENSAIRIVSIIDNDPVLEARMKEQVQAAKQSGQPDKGVGEKAEATEQKEQQTPSKRTDTKEASLTEVEQQVVQPGMGIDFYKGNLRSGQVLESASSITIVGDVNPGAKIVSAGNIVVLGSLKGNAWAGAEGDKSCFIYALEMRPLQLQIGELIAKSPDKEKGTRRIRRKEKDAKNAGISQIATAKDDNIMLEPVTRNILNMLS